MELFKIKHKFTKEILFQGEFESFKDCVEMAIKLEIDFSGADLSGADLSWSNFSGANFSGSELSRVNFSWSNFSGANFSGAELSRVNFSWSNFSWANFSGANFSGANLPGANLPGVNFSGANLYRANFSQVKIDKIEINKTPIQIIGSKWDVIIFDHHMKVGCELHKISEWESFDDKRNNEMDSTALDFWKKNKQFLLSACANNGRG